MTVRALCEANWALLRAVRRLDSASTGYGRSRCLGLAEFDHNSATFGFRPSPSFGNVLVTLVRSGRLRLVYSATVEWP